MDMLLFAIDPPPNVLGETMTYCLGLHPASAMVFRQSPSMLPFRSISNTYFAIIQKVFVIALKSVFGID